MHHSKSLRGTRLTLLAGCAALGLAACDRQPLDFDLRGIGGGFSTAPAATAALAERPEPDDRGVISYPNYQVAVARRGDTLADVAGRIGANTGELARYNGIDADARLRKGEIVALPRRVSEPSPATGAASTGPIQPVDISSLAGNAIDRSPATPGVQTSALPAANATPRAAPAPAPSAQSGKEPVRHRVERGETAYTVARLYDVPVTALAEWNGLGSDFSIREGQFLLIPVPEQSPPRRNPAASATPAPSTQPVPREVAASTPTPAPAPAPAPTLPEATTMPGVGSPTPTPPSAAKPLPKDDTARPLPAASTPKKPVADIGPTTEPVSSGKLAAPVQGAIIRGYAKGKNEGINIKAGAGAPVQAADNGTVAAITNSAEGVPIVVIRHDDNLLTVYANVTGVAVKKGDPVRRGQQIAKLRDGDDSYVHFEVRKGFDSVDPAPYLQ
ncbi:peptidoglycan DD-metalloendopeptidase family protein [Sulfitobacter aestuarii]|uniref:Peptidoglycan DD-metalloendopeptidase family protein n=1 Tax=Sulfitobacter aestuarii TaxID=2161676 RepID=A0ABW5TZE0_9RHOB